MEGAEHVDKRLSLAGVRVVGSGWVFSVAEWQGRVSLWWEASGVQVCVIPSWVSTAVRVTVGWVALAACDVVPEGAAGEDGCGGAGV